MMRSAASTMRSRVRRSLGVPPRGSCGPCVIRRSPSVGVDRLTVYAYAPVRRKHTPYVKRRPGASARRGETRDAAQSRIAREGEQPSPGRTVGDLARDPRRRRSPRRRRCWAPRSPPTSTSRTSPRPSARSSCSRSASSRRTSHRDVRDDGGAGRRSRIPRSRNRSTRCSADLKALGPDVSRPSQPRTRCRGGGRRPAGRRARADPVRGRHRRPVHRDADGRPRRRDRARRRGRGDPRALTRATASRPTCSDR